MILVFDKRTGALLREIQLDGLSAAAPMTYTHQGTPFIVIAVRGGKTSEMVALSVPKTETLAAPFSLKCSADLEVCRWQA